MMSKSGVWFPVFWSDIALFPFRAGDATTALGLLNHEDRTAGNESGRYNVLVEEKRNDRGSQQDGTLTGLGQHLTPS